MKKSILAALPIWLAAPALAQAPSSPLAPPPSPSMQQHPPSSGGVLTTPGPAFPDSYRGIPGFLDPSTGRFFLLPPSGIGEAGEASVEVSVTVIPSETPATPITCTLVITVYEANGLFVGNYTESEPVSPGVPSSLGKSFPKPASGHVVNKLTCTYTGSLGRVEAMLAFGLGYSRANFKF
jgi:hypothetical protein